MTVVSGGITIARTTGSAGTLSSSPDNCKRKAIALNLNYKINKSTALGFLLSDFNKLVKKGEINMVRVMLLADLGSIILKSN